MGKKKTTVPDSTKYFRARYHTYTNGRSYVLGEMYVSKDLEEAMEYARKQTSETKTLIDVIEYEDFYSALYDVAGQSTVSDDLNKDKDE